MSDLFGKQLRKQTARAKEKLLEGLGKAKATQDDVFDQHAANLGKQSKACDRLYRDLKSYGSALRTMVQAQKAFRETIRELYESDWPDREHLYAITHSLDLQWEEFEKTINEQVMGSVSAYMGQFSDLKAKVAKRGRKLVDFDSARNNYATVRASSKKGDEDPRVVKALADLQQAENMYRDLNKELVDALPATYDSRITFFVDTLQTIFNAESVNHAECGKNNKTLVNLLDNLGNSFDSLRVPRIATTQSIVSTATDESFTSLETSMQPKSEVPVPAPRQLSPQVPSVGSPVKTDTQSENETMEKKVYPSLNSAPSTTPDVPAVVPGIEDKKLLKATHLCADAEEKGSKASLNPFDEDEDDDDIESPLKEDGDLLQKGDNQQEEVRFDRKVLHKVRATHRYTAEDTDELTFDAGEIITVLEAQEEDLLDAGWLLGVKQSDGIQGVFPANFTKPL